MLEKISVVLDDKKIRIINIIITVILITQTVLRLALSFNNGEAKGLLVNWLIWIFFFSAFIIMVEIRKPEKWIVWFPLILSKSGRGVFFIFLTLPMFTNEPSTIVLGVLVILGGFFNIIIGWREP